MTVRKIFQASLAKLEEACRQEMEKHKQLLDKEYEQLLTQFSKELEKLQLKHQEELGKRLKMNINTEKKLIKEVSQVRRFYIYLLRYFNLNKL